MRIIKPSFKIIACLAYPLKLIEKAGRTCYKSEKKDITDISSRDFAAKMLKSGHHSVIEHSFMSVQIICDRGVSHEIVRHRLASYSQESTRYCNYTKEKFGGHITFIRPSFFPEIPCDVYEDNNDVQLVGNNSSQAVLCWLQSMLASESHYNFLVKQGCSAQEARSVLPNSLKTELVMTANLREWRHFFTLRTAKPAHPQMREIAIPMLKEFRNLIPVLFDDINPYED